MVYKSYAVLFPEPVGLQPVLRQVQTDPIPHIVVDVRDKRSTEQHSLPPEYDQAIPIPGNENATVSFA